LSNISLDGKTVLITGGNQGIGYEAAKELLKRGMKKIFVYIMNSSKYIYIVGARVIIACRNIHKGEEAVRSLRDESGCDEQNIRLMKCDLLRGTQRKGPFYLIPF